MHAWSADPSAALCRWRPCRQRWARCGTGEACSCGCTSPCTSAPQWHSSQHDGSQTLICSKHQAEFVRWCTSGEFTVLRSLKPAAVVQIPVRVHAAVWGGDAADSGRQPEEFLPRRTPDGLAAHIPWQLDAGRCVPNHHSVAIP